MMLEWFALGCSSCLTSLYNADCMENGSTIMDFSPFVLLMIHSQSYLKNGLCILDIEGHG